MTRILLTGRNGQVGWELERALAPLGEVLAFGRQELDLADPDRIRDAIRAARPDIIVNAAAYTAVDRAESEPDLAMAVNATAPGIIAEEAKRLGTLLVHYSTDYVFDGTKLEPYTETDSPNPINTYGRSKLAGEQAIQATGCRHLIFRTSWVYSLRGQNFLLTIQRLAAERNELSVVDDQVGAPTWSRMIAEATTIILSRSELPEGLFHLAANGRTSWFGFASAALSYSARERVQQPKIKPIPSREYCVPAKRPANSRLCCDRLVAAVGIALPAWDTSLNLCLAEAANS